MPGYQFPDTFCIYNKDLEPRIDKRGVKRRILEVTCTYNNCGKIFPAMIGNLKSKTTKSCGCLHKARTSEASSKDISGQRFGSLIAKTRDGSDKHGQAFWICDCDCGGTRRARGADLYSEKTSSCDSCFRRKTSERNLVDLTGQRFDHYLVLRIAGRNKSGKVLYDCRCDCGVEKSVVGESLVSKASKSCGCIKNVTQLFIFNKIVKPLFSTAISEFSIPNRQFLDIVVESSKSAVEYDGKQHSQIMWYDKGDLSKLEYRKHLDAKKDLWCKENGWRLLRVSELDYKKNPELWNEIIIKFLVEPQF